MKRVFENPNFVDSEGDAFLLRHEIEGRTIWTYRNGEIVASMSGLGPEEIERNIQHFLRSGCHEVVEK